MTADRLNKLNQEFYEAHQGSFSASRRNSWPGWERVLDHVCLPENPGVLDVACGNMRFEAFLEDQLAGSSMGYRGVDSCVGLASGRARALDIVESLIADTLVERLGPERFDFVVSFGFMHHVPGDALRLRLIRSLVEMTSPGGFVAISFWRFMDDAGLADKALRTTARGCDELDLRLDAGDYLVGWNGCEGAYRYCHSFDDDEIDVLVAAVAEKAAVVDRFLADGRTGALNSYIVLQRRVL